MRLPQVSSNTAIVTGPRCVGGLVKRTPATFFGVDDVQAEYERLSAAGVRFTQEPTDMGPVTTAVLDDTCGNLIQIASGGS